MEVSMRALCAGVGGGAPLGGPRPHPHAESHGTISRYETEHHEAPFWHLDEALGELELQAQVGGPEVYSVRLKARTATYPYRGGRELYALQHNGLEHEVAGKAYILLPDVSHTAGGSPVWRGMWPHEIASVRGLFYDQDRAIGVWEIIPARRLDEFTHGRLWLAFES